MKTVSSILDGEKGRGQIAVIGAVILAAAAIITTIVLTGNDGSRLAEADSLAAPAAQVPQDPLSAHTVYMQIRSNGQEIEGESQFDDRFEWTEVLEYNHSVISTTDRASGLPTGRRQHSPMVITKYIDKASPALMAALDNNETIEVTLEFERTSTEGIAETYYKVETTGGRLTGIRRNAGLIGGDTETLSITYGTMTESNELFGSETEIVADGVIR